MTMIEKFGLFVFFIILNIVSLGLYSVWYWITRTEERNMMLKQLVKNTSKRK